MFTQNIEGPLLLAGIQRAHLVSGRRFGHLTNSYNKLNSLQHNLTTYFNHSVNALVKHNPLINTLDIFLTYGSQLKIRIHYLNYLSLWYIQISVNIFSFYIQFYPAQRFYYRFIHRGDLHNINSFSCGYNIYHLTAFRILFILYFLYVGTLVTDRTTTHIFSSFKSYFTLVVSFAVIIILTISSKCYASTNTVHNVVKLHRYSKSSSSPIVKADFIIRINSSKIVLSRSYDNLLSGVKSDTSIIVKKIKQLLYNRNFRIFQKTDRFRTKREYLTTFDNILSYYHNRKELKNNKKLTATNDEKNRSINFRKSFVNYSKQSIAISNNEGNFSETKFSEGALNTTADELRATNVLEIIDRVDDVNYKPSVKKNFQFELSTQRSMPPAHVSENSLNDSSVLVLVVSVVVLTVTLGLVTCVLNHYRGGTAANSHDAAQTPTTAPMLSVVSAGAAASVGGMDRLRSRGTAHELAATRDRQVRVHAVHTDIPINLPPSISLPDGEDHPFNSRLQIRDAEQEAEIYQKCIKPPPNRTVLESESPPPYRSSSAGLLGSISGSSSSSTDWSGGSAPLVVRCHSMSSTSKRQETTSGGQKTDFIQRTVKRFTGKKNQSLTVTNMPVVIVPTKPRRISEQQQQQQSQQQSQQNSTAGRPKPNV